MAMQKLVQEHYATVSDSSTFAYETISADLDEEVLFKRIRLSITNLALTSNARNNPAIVRWALIQADTSITPTAADMADNNRVVATGINNTVLGAGVQTYDHTITMRKLKSSSIYLLYQYAEPSGASSCSVGVYATCQLHYLER